MSNSQTYAEALAGNGASEEQALLPKPAPSSTLAHWRARMKDEVSHTWADVVLLLCYIVTGLLDSTAIQVWGAFVSMQTGELIDSMTSSF